MLDMHSDTWWERALEGTLSPAEARSWQAHLASCADCRVQWAALEQLDAVLRDAPFPPLLPVNFTVRTVAKFQRRRRMRLVWGMLGTIVFVAVAFGLMYLFLGPVFFRIDGVMTAVLAGRTLWLQSLNRLLLSLFNARGVFVSLLLGTVLLLSLLLTPNSVVATLAFVWLTRDKWGREQSRRVTRAMV